MATEMNFEEIYDQKRTTGVTVFLPISARRKFLPIFCLAVTRAVHTR